MESRCREGCALVVTGFAALSIGVLAAPALAAPNTVNPLFKLCAAQKGEPDFSVPLALFTCDKPSGFSDGQARAAGAVVTHAYALFRPQFFFLPEDPTEWAVIFEGFNLNSPGA